MFFLLLVIAAVNAQRDPVFNNFRCGEDFNRANTQCQDECDSDADCPNGFCYKNVSAIACRPASEVTQAWRCGTSWDDANLRCSFLCPDQSDSWCPNGEQCFSIAQENIEACSDEAAAESSRCGTDRTNATQTCGEVCADDGDCPDDQECFTDLFRAVCPETSEPLDSSEIEEIRNDAAITQVTILSIVLAFLALL